MDEGQVFAERVLSARYEHAERNVRHVFWTLARLPKFRGQVDRRNAMTLRLSFDEHHDHVPSPVYGAAKG
jgi:hypothetical protein